MCLQLYMKRNINASSTFLVPSKNSKECMQNYVSIDPCYVLFMPDFFQDNYVVIYELLDEMLDNGFPLATESNILKELIKPPNILRTVVNTVTGKTK